MGDKVMNGMSSESWDSVSGVPVSSWEEKWEFAQIFRVILLSGGSTRWWLRAQILESDL